MWWQRTKWASEIAVGPGIVDLQMSEARGHRDTKGHPTLSGVRSGMSAARRFCDGLIRRAGFGTASMSSCV